MADFLADNDVPFPVVDRLRELGHNVMTLRDHDLHGQSIGD